MENIQDDSINVLKNEETLNNIIETNEIELRPIFIVRDFRSQVFKFLEEMPTALQTQIDKAKYLSIIQSINHIIYTETKFDFCAFID